MVAWTIQAALESNVFDRVVVSTDDSEIAEMSRSYGASVPFLRTRHVDDHSTVSDVTIGVLEQLKSELGEEFETVVQLMPNCPLRSKADILDALDNFELRKAGAQISCFKFGWMNPWWAAEVDGDGHPKTLFPHVRGMRSQDLPALFCPTGAVWIAKSEVLMRENNFYAKNHIYHPMPWESAVDIDDYEDLRMAEALFAMGHQAAR
jgi:N-acylneuraminate cytidylyltransferase